MEITTQKIKEIFNKYNKSFDQKLPEPEFELLKSYRTLGCYTCVRWKNGKIRRPKISISCYIDWEENRLENIIIHEMIHYYISYYRIKDDDDHGEEFRKLAEKFNLKFNLKIAGKYEWCDLEKTKDAPKFKWFLVHLF